VQVGEIIKRRNSKLKSQIKGPVNDKSEFSEKIHNPPKPFAVHYRLSASQGKNPTVRQPFTRTVSLKISTLLHDDRSHEKVSFPSDPGSGHLLHGSGLWIVHTGRSTNGAENRFENGRLGLFGTEVFEAGYSETTLIGYKRP
jgi:hypothetical protein